LYSGTLTKEQKTAIAGKTLKPAIFHDISVDSSITGGSITAATTIAAEASSATGGQTVTLTAAPDEGYELDTVTVTKNGGGTVATSGTGNTRTFTMPLEAVTVSATFTLAPKTGSCGASASDHVTYTLTDTDKDNKYDKLEIAGTGAMADFQVDGSNLPWYDHRENIKTLTIAEGVTRIGTGAFYDVVGITSVTIPASVTGIGDNAFASDGKDTALTTVSFASGSQCRSIGSSAFNNRRGLTGITLPAALESIGGGVFYMNEALTSINIPAKVTSIGEGAFQSCDNLATVRIFGSPATIGSEAFYAGGSTPNGLTVYALAVNKTEALESLYEDSDGSPRNLVYICTAPEAPAENSLTYNGAEQTVAIAAPANCGYTVTGDKQTNVGSYTATATLNTGKSEEISFPRITITKQYVWGDASTLTPATSDETDAKTYDWSIAPKPVTVSGIKAKNKEYDATTTATLDYSGVTFTGKADGDSLTVTARGVFENTSAGEDKTVTISGLTLGGESVGNYTLANSGQQTSATATILPKPVIVSGITATNKVYDGTEVATLDCTNLTFTGKLDSDTLTVTATGSFADANVENNKTVNISNLALGGEAADNYILAESGQQETTTVNITPREITITAADQSVELGGSIATGLEKVSVTSGELVSGQSITDVTLTASSTGAVTTTGTITPSAVTIKSGDTDVTANYNITYTNGTLTVTKVRAKVTTVPTAKMGLIYSGESQTLLETNGVVDTAMEYALGSDADTAPVSGYSETVPSGTDAKTYYIWYRAKSDENHEAGEPAVLTVEIAKATPEITTIPTAMAITYGQTLGDSALSGGEATSSSLIVAGGFAWSDTTISPEVSDSNKTEYTVKFTPTDSVNYNEATCKVKLTVNKATITESDITVPTAKTGLTYTGSAQALITAGSCEYGIMQYALGTATEATEPYTTTIPTGTNAGTYHVWYK
ncbi:MAG: leucine-rich repeat protein, partial [Ruminiclostridium sp.]|nr:leucine-rich repeat protein [Ruminiclostridium sp.]